MSLFWHFLTIKLVLVHTTEHFIQFSFLVNFLRIRIFDHNAYLYHVSVCKICKMCQALSTLLVLTNAALRFQSCLMGFCLYFNRFVDLGGTDRMLVGRSLDSRKYQQQYKQLRFCKQHVNNKYSN